MVPGDGITHRQRSCFVPLFLQRISSLTPPNGAIRQRGCVSLINPAHDAHPALLVEGLIELKEIRLWIGPTGYRTSLHGGLTAKAALMRPTCE
jgi:hypothetical protein